MIAAGKMRSGLIGAILVAACLGGCAPKQHDPLVGKWQSMLGNWAQFNEDHTFSSGISPGSPKMFEGKWLMAGSKVIVQVTKTAGRPVPASMARTPLEFGLSADGKLLVQKTGSEPVEFVRLAKP